MMDYRRFRKKIIKMNWTFSLYLLFMIYIGQADASSFILEADIKPQCGGDETGTIWQCNYLPQSVPGGFTTVDILAQLDSGIYCDQNSFQSHTWLHVETLRINSWTEEKDVKLSDYCFRNLKNLKYLSINIEFWFNLSSNTLYGLDSVLALSLSDCTRLEWFILLNALDGSNKLPNMTDLDLTQVQAAYGLSIQIDETFVNILATRNLTRLNLSGLQVSFLNLTTIGHSLKQLYYLNCSSMNLNQLEYKGNADDIKHVKEIDMSNMTLPKSMVSPGIHRIYNIAIRYHKDMGTVTDFFYIQKVIFNGAFRIATFEMFNCKLVLEDYIPMLMETITFRDNNFKYLDIQISGDIKYRNTTIKHLDISHNGMEFLHPSLLSFVPNLETLQLSENSLYKMVERDSELFADLLKNNSKLKSIDLSTNGLKQISAIQFFYNWDLEEINLSNNLLQQVRWDLVNQMKLKILNLRNNQISILDATSLANLDILTHTIPVEDQLELLIANNPLSCSTCESKPFITWLTKAGMVHLSEQKLTCTQENGVQGNIDQTQVNRVQFICERRILIIACSASAGFVVICVAILTYALLRRRKIRLRRMRLHQLLANIQQGEGEFEFVVMLSYNNIEEDFIRQNVLEPLNETLQTMTGADRELVLTGDQHFRPGFMVHNEIASSLERVSLVIMLITNEFCTSGFCLSELDQAWIQRKPMIFMFKDEVDRELMTPIMKTIYKKNARILWTLEDGKYVLKTTWENVCDAILQLIIQ